MGLDLLVREQVDFRTDSKGRSCWTVVELFNLRNCWQILDCLNWKLADGFENCGTHSFFEGQIFGILKALKNEIETEKDNDEQVKQLKYEIECLEKFIEQENLKEQDSEYEEYGRTFEIHAWW